MEDVSNSDQWKSSTRSALAPSGLSSVLFVLILSIGICANLMYGAVSNGALGVLAILTAVVVVLWIADSLFAKELGYSASPLLLPLVGLILIALIQLLPFGGSAESTEVLGRAASSALSIDPYATRLAILKLFIFIIFFAAALTYIDSPKRVRRVAFILIIYGAFMSFFGILQKLANPDLILWIRQVDYATPFATYINQHHFASFLVMISALTLGLLFGGSTKPDKRVLFIIALVLMGLGIVFTSSRGALLSLISVIVFLTALSFWFGRKTTSKEHRNTFLKRMWVLIGANVLLIVFLLVSVFYLGGSDIAFRSAGLSGPEDASNGRLQFWFTTAQIIKDNPILGTGLDTYMMSYTKYDTGNGVVRVNQAHNEYLQVFSEGGIFAFLLVIAFIMILFRRSFKVINSTHHPFRRGIAAGGLAACLGVLIHSLFDFPLRTNANMFFFLICAVLATVEVDFPGLVRKKIRKRGKKRSRDSEKEIIVNIDEG